MADTEPEARKPYHHGNLRQALVEASLALIEEKLPRSMWASGSHDEDDMPWACVTRLDLDRCPDFTGSAVSPARALLAAFLRAHKEQHDGR